MGPLDTLNHLVNFLAPALAVGLVLALLGPLLIRKRPGAPVLLAQAAINFAAGALALLLGLWFFGNDGKMASYAAMLLLSSAAQASSGRWGK
ncbi:MAG: hypothetical protein CFE43_07280 [Burkholderiales bacterium PBB3]|nr:MAG: hypothetical protein CFE43_07280 [Burkholderiales bacterium PBB3]